ncbi:MULTISPECIES: glycosyltransferase [unclassified Bradyrhizobium]|uniref:glycosyltransferase family protein n=1 Tax=unclassified Bradyrhizobium TaxID=2631580 RepID=UPI001FF78E93|nr:MULTISPECIES: glycosyltransferase [unclassified Bradyrhizobium]MCK1709636.1 glycosyltransferase family 1 protein [Bradyrhizobium sp. 143]MCK1731597.1 glycosyltransferase family 1 protein [Bradyrhizobium sp. 142]
MNHDPSKPKLLFFQCRHGKELPEFLVMHRLQQVKCLSEFFDVVVIQEDCDYRRVCDQYEPDLALFEMLSGAELLNTRRPEIANARTCRDIPKLAFFNADAWCDARAGFLSDMEHMAIDTAFSICTTAAEHTPELADKLFVWPNFIDPDVYRDYGQAKVIPAFFTGAMSTLYPWRRKIEGIVADHYPSLLSPHHGYVRRPRAGRMMYGETYARAINASWFVPTCGTVAKDVLRKHFEIPGCKACLITEQSAALESAGFVDMHNCVFADETTVLDKLAYLLEHEEELVGIIQAGYEFAHAHHTLRQRDQILQWFHLNKKLRAGEKIVQENPFGRLIVTDGSSGRSNHPTGQGIHLTLLQQGDAALWAGDYPGAGALYRRSSNYIPWMPEPNLRLALSNLYLGDAKAAYAQITELVRYIAVEYKAADPDPVEWAYLIVSLLCLGKLNEASQRASQFPALRHPELDHARWAVEALTTRGTIAPLPGNGVYRCSIHQMPQRTLKDWIEQLCIILRACKQPEFSAELMELRSLRQGGGGLSAPRNDAPANRNRGIRKHSPIELLPVSSKNSSLRQRVRTRIRRGVGDLMHRLERRYGYFLPYQLSEMRNDEFLREVRKLAREKPFQTALLMGAAKGDGITEAFLSGVMENENKPTVFCISSLENELSCLEKAFADHGRVNCYGIAICSEDELVGQLQMTATQIKKDHGLNGFEVVVIDGSKFKQLAPCAQLRKELHNATHILLDDINGSYNHMNYHQLVRDPDFVTVDCNLGGLRDGYAIFEKIKAPRRRTISARADC